MILKIDGQCYKEMLLHGISNLNKHANIINKLNVFPVPDGDTGTNMVVTVKRGLSNVQEQIADLSTFAKKFSQSIVFEARGNSGVILSQFFKGVSETFFDRSFADAPLLIKALEHGVDCAYGAVANPVDGTMLTVLKDATAAAKRKLEQTSSIDEIMNTFIDHAKISLENTPNFLPALKDAGVVDSGGAGVVYLFEGMKKYLDGEPLTTSDYSEDDEESKCVDYSAFNRSSTFEFGYCTELLIQLLDSRKEFDYSDFKDKLYKMGDSVVTSHNDDKVRIHIHTHTPEQIFSFCHEYGEFLSLKVENMTVQHTEQVQSILRSSDKNGTAFSVVAVAHDRAVQKMLLDMGADVVIYSEESASTKDFVDAFEMTDSQSILVYPNSSDSVLAAIQAKNIYNKASITVINSKGIAECYASLPTIDFEEENIETVVDGITEVIQNLYVVSVSHRSGENDELKPDSRAEYYSYSGKEIISISSTLVKVATDSIDKVLKKHPKDIITIFHGDAVSDAEIEEITEAVAGLGIYAEIFTVKTEKMSCDMTLSFE